MGKSIRRATGYGSLRVDVFPTPVIAQRAPGVGDSDYPICQQWVHVSVDPKVIYQHLGNGEWQTAEVAVALASTSEFGIVKLDDDLSDGIAPDSVPTAGAAKTYIDNLIASSVKISNLPTLLASLLSTPPAIGQVLPAAGSFSDLKAKQLQIKGGLATDNIGIGTLVNGTVTIHNTNISAFDRININRTSLNNSPTLGFLAYSITPGASFKVTSYNAAGAVLPNDKSSFSYQIFRQV